MKWIIILFVFITNASYSQVTLFYKDDKFSYILFRDSLANDECTIKLIFIKDLITNRLVQKIKPEENDSPCELTKDLLFKIQDFDGDGIKDIALIKYLPNDSNVPYYYWCYNKVERKFRLKNIK